MTLRFLLPALLLAGSTGWCLQTSSPGEAPGSVRRALLIGINAYASPEVPSLRGCVNDVEAMRLVLTGRFGFASGDVRVLTDGEATRAGILAALDELVAEARPEDLVFIHYAGHGSQVRDDDGDEEDDRDETLVPHDGRTEGVPDITDDELNALLGRLRARSAVIVLDCCHSGTGTRSVAVRARRIEEDTRSKLYRGGKVATRAIVPLPSERYVLMTGAADHESALDGPIEGSYHGAFSFALTRSLAAAPADAAPRLLFQGVESEIRRLGEQWMISSMPEPQLEAPAELLDRALLPPPPDTGAQAPTARVAWCEVDVDPATRRASLDAHALGAVAGALWAIYPPGESAFEPDGCEAIAEVVALGQGRAYLALAGEEAEIAGGSRAILAAPPPAPQEIPVHVRGPSAEQAEALAAELRAALPGFRGVGAAELALLYVDLGRPDIRVLGSDGVSLVASLRLGAEEHAAEKLARVIQRCLDSATLVALDNPTSGMQLEVQVGSPSSREATRIGQRGFKVVTDNAAPVFRFRQGGRSSQNSLQLAIRASTDCYLTIVDIDAEGSMNLLFPTERAHPTFLPEGRINGGEWHEIPDSLEDPNDAGFWWDAGPPAGMDTIRVFASTDLRFAEELRDALRSLEEAAAQLASRGLTREVHASRRAGLGVLRRSLAGRGFAVVTSDSHAPPLDPAGESEPMEAADSDSAEPAFDWTAVSTTVRIEAR